jgi:hypothetical protein
MLYKAAAEHYEKETGDMVMQLVEARRGRRRFPHH